jgi:hypothetical protein
VSERYDGTLDDGRDAQLATARPVGQLNLVPASTPVFSICFWPVLTREQKAQLGGSGDLIPWSSISGVSGA